MRGELKEVKKLVISGRVFNEFDLRDKAMVFLTGDIMLYATIDSKIQIEAEDYNFMGYRGYFKAKVFDGKNWNHILLDEFLTARENRFPKNEYIMAYFLQTKEAMEQFAGKVLNKTYRDHYTLKTYVLNPYKGKKGHWS
jgi:hypothetical protein